MEVFNILHAAAYEAHNILCEHSGLFHALIARLQRTPKMSQAELTTFLQGRGVRKYALGAGI